MDARQRMGEEISNRWMHGNGWGKRFPADGNFFVAIFVGHPEARTNPRISEPAVDAGRRIG
ncbi:MAG: hypothetical protein JXR37_27830, partial [Kiritimatiellae bacterium]|nr:hypothetical protein [Kiritimatiellia bacterium]